MVSVLEVSVFIEISELFSVLSTKKLVMLTRQASTLAMLTAPTHRTSPKAAASFVDFFR